MSFVIKLSLLLCIFCFALIFICFHSNNPGTAADRDETLDFSDTSIAEGGDGGLGGSEAQSADQVFPEAAAHGKQAVVQFSDANDPRVAFDGPAAVYGDDNFIGSNGSFSEGGGKALSLDRALPARGKQLGLK